MTERFVIDDNIRLDENKIETYELSTLVDTETKNFYFIVDDTANVQSFCNRLNKLHDRNRRLESLIVEMLDYIKDKGAVTHNEMKDWWNAMMKGDVE